MKRRLSEGLGAALLLMAATTEQAAACVACGCGDPTLTAMGAEKPLVHRLRLSLEARNRSDAVGQPGLDELKLQEQRADLQVAWAPHERLFLLATAPFLFREVTYVNLARSSRTAVGDVEIRAKAFIYQDRPFASRHLVSLLVGAKLATAPEAKGVDAVRLPTELQPGTGSIDPLLGLAYAHFAPPWSFYASAVGAFTTTGRQGMRASRSLRGTLAAQRQWSSFGLRAAFETRLDGRALEDGRGDPHSGGFVGYVGADLLWSPLTDLLVLAGARFPAMKRLHGQHDEGPVASLGVAVDL